MTNPLVQRIGRLQRLAVFEAAARHGSFAGAAAELGVTQPGVSRQIRVLEQALGAALFERQPNRILLTDFGRELLAAVQEGFERIESAADRSGPDTDRRFVLAANPGLAQRWLVPRLDSLQQAMEATEIHLWLFDRDQGVFSGGFDAAVHLGRGPWPGLRHRALFPEVTMPVAAPDLAARLGLTATTPPSELLAVELLHLDGDDRTWMDWADWFAHHGVDPGVLPARSTGGRITVSYNNYALVTQDAVAGVGVALGWRTLVDDLLRRDLLTVVGPEAPGGIGYELLWPPSTPDADIDRLARWLLAQIDDEAVEPSQVDPTVEPGVDHRGVRKPLQE